MKVRIVGGPVEAARKVEIECQPDDSFAVIMISVESAVGKGSIFGTYNLHLASVVEKKVKCGAVVDPDQTPAQVGMKGGVMMLKSKSGSNPTTPRDSTPRGGSQAASPQVPPIKLDTLKLSYEQRVRALFEKYDPGKVGQVRALLTKYAGKEEAAIHSLVKKYGPEPQPAQASPAPATGGGSSAGASTPHTPSTGGRNYRDRIVALFELYDPSKAHQADTLLKKYEGKEGALINSLVKKYGPEPTAVEQPAAPPPAEQPAAAEKRPAEKTYLERVQAIYKKYEPSKVGQAQALLAKYPGKEETVINSLVKKFGPEPTDEADEKVPPPQPKKTPAAATEQTPSPAKQPAAAEKTTLERVTAILAKYDSAKVKQAGALVNKNQGKEAALIASLVKKYGPEPTDDTAGTQAEPPVPPPKPEPKKVAPPPIVPEPKPESPREQEQEQEVAADTPREETPAAAVTPREETTPVESPGTAQAEVLPPVRPKNVRIAQFAMAQLEAEVLRPLLRFYYSKWEKFMIDRRLSAAVSQGLLERLSSSTCVAFTVASKAEEIEERGDVETEEELQRKIGELEPAKEAEKQTTDDSRSVIDVEAANTNTLFAATSQQELERKQKSIKQAEASRRLATQRRKLLSEMLGLPAEKLASEEAELLALRYTAVSMADVKKRLEVAETQVRRLEELRDEKEKEISEVLVPSYEKLQQLIPLHTELIAEHNEVTEVVIPQKNEKIAKLTEKVLQLGKALKDERQGMPSKLELTIDEKDKQIATQLQQLSQLRLQVGSLKQSEDKLQAALAKSKHEAERKRDKIKRRAIELIGTVTPEECDILFMSSDNDSEDEKEAKKAASTGSPTRGYFSARSGQSPSPSAGDGKQKRSLSPNSFLTRSKYHDRTKVLLARHHQQRQQSLTLPPPSHPIPTNSPQKLAETPKQQEEEARQQWVSVDETEFLPQEEGAVVEVPQDKQRGESEDGDSVEPVPSVGNCPHCKITLTAFDGERFSRPGSDSSHAPAAARKVAFCFSCRRSFSAEELLHRDQWENRQRWLASKRAAAASPLLSLQR